MSKMKHLLRKLHIGGSVNEHHRLADDTSRHTSPSPSTTPAPSSSTAPTAPPPTEPRRTGAAVSDGSVDFNFFEEEYQVQLALAISASSDLEAHEDPDSVQIKAAKRMSLGCSPSLDESLVDFLSIRYWNYNVINYDEKIVDGFYDVYGIVSTPKFQGKMPSLVDLQGTSISDNVDCEVVLVNRPVDQALQQLERRAISIASECRTVELGLIGSGLVQKIADLVVDCMGGPVGDADDMLRCWTVKSYELRTSLNSIVLPLGCLEVGLSRHRALLFKVLADRISIPCRLVKGSYYTGTDEGAVNLIRIDYDSEYIVDLMGAPGTLIPAEIPGSHLQNAGFDIMGSSTIEQTVKDLCSALDKDSGIFEKKSQSLEGGSCDAIFVPNVAGSGSDDASRVATQAGADDGNLAERNHTERFEHDFGKLLPLLSRPGGGLPGPTEAASPAQQMKVKDVSKYVLSAAQNPEFAQKLHAVLLESGASPPPDLFSDIRPSQEIVSQSCLVEGRKMDEVPQLHNDPSHIDQSLMPFVGRNSFTHFDYENGKNHSAEEMSQKQRLDTNVSDNILTFEKPCVNSSSSDKAGFNSADLYFPLGPKYISPGVCSPFVTTNEGLMLPDGGGNKMVPATSTDEGAPVLDSSIVMSTTLYREQMHKISIPCEADSFKKQLENALAGGGAEYTQGAGRVGQIVETKGSVCLQECEGSTKDSIAKSTENTNNNPHIASNASNERFSPVLDDVAEWEIHWEDLQLGERIGLGSYGEVYHADWNGTEVAVKKFLDQEFSGDALEQFRCEVKIMLRLRHPNVVLFMGAVTRPPNLSILTEFLPRGSLYRLLHRPNIQLDEKRRLRMALDVAKGMNYLHTSHPTIVHRDLKSPNLLVDKNWVVKVCDFGLSRLKHHTFLSSKSTAGTPEWMAPEVLRNEPSNEKCDVYSFGVILWEMATLRMPWSGMNPMQVVGAVGFQNRRLDIPKEVDPMVAQIICDCWQSEPNRRPSFAQLMSRLKHLQHLVAEIS